jgi:AcrR family transcriptional regulator
VNDIQLNILHQAFTQFKQFGFKNVTMDDLARNIGISKKTIYENFKDKEELVFEVIKNMTNTNQRKIDEASKKSINAIEQLMKIIAIMAEMIQGMNVVCFMDLQRYYPKAYEYLEKHRHDCMKRDVTQNLLQGVEEGLFRKEIDVEIISIFRMESAMLIFKSNLFNNIKHDILKINNELFAHYMYGIATIKGHKLIDKYYNKEAEKCSFPQLFKTKK